MAIITRGLLNHHGAVERREDPAVRIQIGLTLEKFYHPRSDWRTIGPIDRQIDKPFAALLPRPQIGRWMMLRARILSRESRFGAHAADRGW